MRIKAGFILQEVAGNTVALPTEGELNMMITLNGTGAFLWQQLEQERSREELIQALLAAYEVDADTAEVCVDRFVAQLNEHGFLA